MRSDSDLSIAQAEIQRLKEQTDRCEVTIGHLTRERNAAESQVSALQQAMQEKDAALREARDAITVAIYGEDGLDGLVGEAVIRSIDAALLSARPVEPKPTKIQHLKDGDSTRCGAARERGNSYYEWAYVNCPACLATRPPFFSVEPGSETKA